MQRSSNRQGSRTSPRDTHTLDQLGIYHNENSHALKHKPRRLYGTIGHAYTVCNHEYEHYAVGGLV